jgi:hypothetical protein
MTERVARAIARAHIYATTICRVEPGLSQAVEEYWTGYEAEARAAIAAMREPAEGMIKAGWMPHPQPEFRCDIPREPADAWRAMIDAALAESAP